MVMLNQRMRLMQPAALTLLLGWVLSTTAGCGKDEPRTLTFVQPTGEVNLGPEDDANPSLPLIQYTVRLASVGLASDTPVRLELRAAMSDDDFETVAESVVLGGSTVNFTEVSFNGGEFELRAVAPNEGVTSESARINVTLGCGRFTWLDPAVPTGAETIEVGQGQNVTTGLCSENFALKLVARTTVPDGTSIELLVNGQPDQTQTAAAVIEFNNVPLSGANPDTVNQLAARYTLGTEVCSVPFPAGITVDCDRPSLTIQSPTLGAVLTRGNDCDPDTEALEIEVVAVTDAAEGSTVTANFASASGGPSATATTTVADGRASLCVPASEAAEQTLTVSVSDEERGLAEQSRLYRFLFDAPASVVTLAIDPTVNGRRKGDFGFSFSTVGDATGAPLSSYDLRCANSPITDAASFTAARLVHRFTATTGSDLTVGNQLSLVAPGFRPGITFFCAVRGFDAGGFATPLSEGVVSAIDPFIVETIPRPTTIPDGQINFGQDIELVGDVNGDGFSDFFVTTTTNKGYLIFGSASGIPSADDVVTFTGAPATAGERWLAVGLGDFNGDGRPDFAVGEPAGDGFDGVVYVFFGRPSTEPWPTEVDLTGTCPDTAICVRANSPAGEFSLNAANNGLAALGDIDGDNKTDLAFSSLTYDQVYVVFGRDLPPGTDRFLRVSEAEQTAVDGVIINGPVPSDDPNHNPPALAVNDCRPGEFVLDGASACRFGNSITVAGQSSAPGETAILISEPQFSAPTCTAAQQGLPRCTPPANGYAGLNTAARLWRVVGFNSPAAEGEGLRVSTAPLQLVARRPDARTTFAALLRPVGDFDGDGLNDVAFYWNRLVGTVSVLFGSSPSSVQPFAESLGINNDTAANSQTRDRFGLSIARAFVPGYANEIGDLDGDGVSDLLVGSRRSAGNPGDATLFYGDVGRPVQLSRSSGSLTFSQAGDLTSCPETVPNCLPRRPNFIGDVSGDGFNDFALADAGADGRVGNVAFVR